MVKVKVERSHKEIVTIKIFDHAGYADAGQDLVCAGVSSISVGMMNALDLLVPETCIFQLKEAYVEIKTKQSNEKDFTSFGRNVSSVKDSAGKLQLIYYNK